MASALPIHIERAFSELVTTLTQPGPLMDRFFREPGLIALMQCWPEQKLTKLELRTDLPRPAVDPETGADRAVVGHASTYFVPARIAFILAEGDDIGNVVGYGSVIPGYNCGNLRYAPARTNFFRGPNKDTNPNAPRDVALIQAATMSTYKDLVCRGYLAEL